MLSLNDNSPRARSKPLSVRIWLNTVSCCVLGATWFSPRHRAHMRPSQVDLDAFPRGFALVTKAAVTWVRALQDVCTVQDHWSCRGWPGLGHMQTADSHNVVHSTQRHRQCTIHGDHVTCVHACGCMHLFESLCQQLHRCSCR